MSKFLRIVIFKCCLTLATIFICLGLTYIVSKFGCIDKSGLDKLEFLAIVGPTILIFLT